MPTSFQALWTFVTVAVISWKLLGAAIHKAAVRKTTVLNELEELGSPRQGGKLSGTVVVAGGSFTGLLAARVLSDHYERVTVVEPDPELDEKRTRVGQWIQGHAYLPITLTVLRRMFPDFDREAVRKGLLIRSQKTGFAIHGRELLAPDDRLAPSIAGSRIVLESLIRELVRKHCSNVEFISGAVTSVTPSSDKSRISSVTCRTANNAEKVLEAALLVDCTGPACAATKWLPRANPAWASVERDEYDPRVWYQSTILQLDQDLIEQLDFGRPESWDKLGWLYAINPAYGSGEVRGFGATRLEGDQLLLAFTRWGGSMDGGPATLADFAAQSADIAESSLQHKPNPGLLRSLDLLASRFPGPPTWNKHKVAGGLYHLRYDKCTQDSIPANLVILGDAMMRVNPIFGQGCGKAAIDVATLDGALRAATSQVSGTDRVLGPEFATAMLKKQMPRLRAMFDTTRLIDYDFPETLPMKGETLESKPFLRAYLREFLKLCQEDEEVAVKHWSASSRLAPATINLHPLVVAKVAWRAWRRL